VRCSRPFAADDRHSYSKFAQALQVSVRKRPLSILEEPQLARHTRCAPGSDSQQAPLLSLSLSGSALTDWRSIDIDWSFMCTILAEIATFECHLIRERIKSGLAIPAARIGWRLGQRPSDKDGSAIGSLAATPA
jgi:hypothetical protein